MDIAIHVIFILTIRLACPSQLPPPVGTMKLEIGIEEAEEGVTGGKVLIRCSKLKSESKEDFHVLTVNS